jgi:hypothetical protein
MEECPHTKSRADSLLSADGGADRGGEEAIGA